MPGAEHDQIRGDVLASLRPCFQVMEVAVAGRAATGEATATAIALPNRVANLGWYPSRTAFPFPTGSVAACVRRRVLRCFRPAVVDNDAVALGHLQGCLV